MNLGENILKLRKEFNLSQEQLAEKVGVSRQTISNWELGETMPNPEQLKILSKTLNVSIDELLDNDIKLILEKKISNTEKLAGVVLKILKIIGITLIIFFIIDFISLIIFMCFKKDGIISSNIKEVELNCKMNDNDYIITVGSDGYYNCSNCSLDLQKEIKNNYIDFENINNTSNNIIKYFENNNGKCE